MLDMNDAENMFWSARNSELFIDNVTSLVTTSESYLIYLIRSRTESIYWCRAMSCFSLICFWLINYWCFFWLSRRAFLINTVFYWEFIRFWSIYWLISSRSSYSKIREYIYSPLPWISSIVIWCLSFNLMISSSKSTIFCIVINFFSECLSSDCLFRCWWLL